MLQYFTQPTAQSDADRDFKLALEVHGELCALIAPVTPGSIRASSWRENMALLSIVSLGAVSSLVVVLCRLLATDVGAKLSWLVPPEVRQLLELLAAAGLGSAFYALYTATGYLQKREFNPDYNQMYLVRYALGVFAGFILGSYSADLFASSSADAKQLGRAALALVGGYSSEAVAQLLQRTADTLVALVKGSGKEQAQAEAETETAKTMAKLSADLQEAAADPAKLVDRVREISKQILK